MGGCRTRKSLWNSIIGWLRKSARYWGCSVTSCFIVAGQSNINIILIVGIVGFLFLLYYLRKIKAIRNGRFIFWAIKSDLKTDWKLLNFNEITGINANNCCFINFTTHTHWQKIHCTALLIKCRVKKHLSFFSSFHATMII